MKRNFIRSGSAILTAIFFSTALSGCSIQRPDIPSPSSASAYESYSESSLETQHAFDKLTNKVFKKQLSESQLSLHYLLKDPSAYQISSVSNAFGDSSLDGIKKSLLYGKYILTELDALDEKLLTPDQRLTAEVLKSYLNTEQKLEGLELYAQPLMPTIGIQAQLPVLLCEYSFYSKQDVDDYLELLKALPDFYQSIFDFEKQKASAGLMGSDRTIDHIIASCESYLLVPGDNFMESTFEERLNTLTDLSEEEKESYMDSHSKLLEEAFVPAYQTLINGMKALKGTGANKKGLCGYPEGRQYYEYLVYSSCNTSSQSVDLLLKAMKTQLASDLEDVSEVSGSNPAILKELDSYKFKLSDPAGILEDLKSQSMQYYPEPDACNYTIKFVPKSLELSLSPAFYLTPPIDDSKNNVIYINQNKRWKNNDLYTVLAHEGYPGHLYQSVYYNSKYTDPIRQIMSFKGYDEGWATYVEHYSWFYDNGLSPDLATILSANSAAVLGIQAILDIYVNYEGWTVEQVADYLSDYYHDIDNTEVAQNLFDALVDKPSNFLEYYVGYMEIQNMREKAEKTLKEKFDPVEFHRFLLDMGPAPFDVIQKYFSSWLLEQKL